MLDPTQLLVPTRQPLAESLRAHVQSLARFGAEALAQVAPPAGAPPPAAAPGAGAPPAGSAPAASGTSMMLQFALPVLVFVGFYFFLIRPQQTKQKELESKLKRGDTVVTQSGLIGVIEQMTDKVITLEIAKGTKVRVLRASVASLYEGDAPASKTDDAKIVEAKK